MSRKLASVQRIESVRKHPNADSLDLVMVNGWQCVTKLGEFKLGDEIIYLEPDSFLPIKPQYEFLRKSCYRNTEHLGEGFRLRTVKLRGELSQGLVLPIQDIAASIGTDVTELLEIKKWEPPVPTSLSGHAKGSFPFFVRKTDQDRVQNIYKDMDLLEKEYNNGIPISWNVEEKIDGSSCSIYYHNGEIGICSRNLELKLDDEFNKDNAFIMTATQSGYLRTLEDLKLEIAIQAELCGPGIQGNIYNLKTLTLFVFDVWFISEQRYATYKERQSVLSFIRNQGVVVQEVPYLGQVTFSDYLNESLKMADGKSVINPKTRREGIVFKSEKPYGVGGIKSFKAVSNEFLLSEKE